MEIVFNSNKPKYIQLFEQISKMINTGHLKGDTKLPSKRNLAISLNVSLNTVVNAYDLLLDEGFIYSIEKKGYFVSNQPIVTSPNVEANVSKNEDKKIKYDFSTQTVEAFNNQSFKKLVKEIIDTASYENKENIKGNKELRIAISKHLYENRAINVSYDQIIIGPGLEMFEQILSIIGINTITLENPGYHKLAGISKNIGLNTKYISLDNDGVLVPNEKTILYTTPFNQFPTGIKMSITRKKELIKWAIDTNSYIIEDDFDAEFRINSAPTTALYTLSNDRVIFFSTLSTTLFPGLRLSYAILPNSLLKKYEDKYKTYSSTVSSINQKILCEFINRGYYASHINKLKKQYLKKREKCIEVLEDNNIKCDLKKNYLSILIESDNITIKDDIKIHSLSDFDVNKEKSNIYILGYTAIQYNLIEDAIKHLLKK